MGGGRLPLRPKIVSISCSFFVKFGKLVCWRSPPPQHRGLVPPPTENPGSAPALQLKFPPVVKGACNRNTIEIRSRKHTRKARRKIRTRSVKAEILSTEQDHPSFLFSEHSERAVKPVLTMRQHDRIRRRTLSRRRQNHDPLLKRWNKNVFKIKLKCRTTRLIQHLPI